MGSEGKVTGWVMFFFFVFVLLFTLYDVFRTEGLRVTAFLLPVFLVSINFMNKYGIWSVWLKGKGFMFKTGVKGTVVRGPFVVDNRRLKYYVSVYGGFLSDEAKKDALGHFWYFYYLVSQRVVIPIIAERSKFRELESRYCDDPRGCIIYHGSPNETEVYDEYESMSKEVDALHHRLGTYETAIHKLNLENETFANSQDKNVVKVARIIKSITSQVDKPIIVAGMAQQGMVDLNQRRD